MKTPSCSTGSSNIYGRNEEIQKNHHLANNNSYSGKTHKWILKVVSDILRCQKIFLLSQKNSPQNSGKIWQEQLNKVSS